MQGHIKGFLEEFVSPLRHILHILLWGFICLIFFILFFIFFLELFLFFLLLFRFLLAFLGFLIFSLSTLFISFISICKGVKFNFWVITIERFIFLLFIKFSAFNLWFSVVDCWILFFLFLVLGLFLSASNSINKLFLISDPFLLSFFWSSFSSFVTFFDLLLFSLSSWFEDVFMFFRFLLFNLICKTFK